MILNSKEKSKFNWKLKYNFPEAEIWIIANKSPFLNYIGLPTLNYHPQKVGILCPKFLGYQNDPIGILMEKNIDPKKETFNYLWKLYQSRYWDTIMESKNSKNISIFDIRNVFFDFAFIMH